MLVVKPSTALLWHISSLELKEVFNKNYLMLFYNLKSIFTNCAILSSVKDERIASEMQSLKINLSKKQASIIGTEWLVAFC